MHPNKEMDCIMFPRKAIHIQVSRLKMKILTALDYRLDVSIFTVGCPSFPNALKSMFQLLSLYNCDGFNGGSAFYLFLVAVAKQFYFSLCSSTPNSSWTAFEAHANPSKFEARVDISVKATVSFHFSLLLSLLLIV